MKKNISLDRIFHEDKKILEYYSIRILKLIELKKYDFFISIIFK